MKQEQKELLLKDLCVRLPYGVKVSVNQSELQNYDYKWKNWSFDEEPQEIDSVSIYGVTFGCMDMSDGVIGFEYIKPYLFPLSSMTDAQCKELRNLIHEHFTLEDEFNEGICFKTYGDILVWLDEKPINECYFIFDWFNKNHLDYRGLIEKSLALDATKLGIYE